MALVAYTYASYPQLAKAEQLYEIINDKICLMASPRRNHREITRIGVYCLDNIATMKLYG